MTASQNDNLRWLDTVALTIDLSEHHLLRGQVGTIVEILSPGVFEVEFSDDQGRTYAQLALRDDQLMVMHINLSMRCSVAAGPELLVETF